MTLLFSKTPSNQEIRNVLDNCKIIRECLGKEVKKGEFIRYKNSQKRILYLAEVVKTVGIDSVSFLPRVAEIQLRILGSYYDNEKRNLDFISGKYLNDDVEVLDLKFL
jgi:hypothetical protein